MIDVAHSTHPDIHCTDKNMVKVTELRTTDLNSIMNVSDN